MTYEDKIFEIFHVLQSCDCESMKASQGNSAASHCCIYCRSSFQSETSIIPALAYYQNNVPHKIGGFGVVLWGDVNELPQLSWV